MSNLRLVLADEHAFYVSECGVVPHVVVTFDSFADVMNCIETFTAEGNLSAMSVFKGDALLMEYQDVVIDCIQIVFGGTYTVHFHMREENGHEGATEEDLDRSNAYDILFGMNDEEDEEVEE